jgi:hypothetical protein
MKGDDAQATTYGRANEVTQWLLVNGSVLGATVDIVHAFAEFLICSSQACGQRVSDLVAVPRLENPSKITAGAARHSALCAGCRLAPGIAPMPRTFQ